MSKNLNDAGKDNDSVLTPSTIWAPWARALERLDLRRFTLDPCGCDGQDEIALDTVYLPDDGLYTKHTRPDMVASIQQQLAAKRQGKES